METENIEIREKQIRIQRFSKSLIPEFVELFKTSFGKPISASEVEVKYNTKAFGIEYLGYMAFHNETAIAYYGVLAVPFILNGKDLIAVQSADTMTHPDYRRHGLFPLLAKKTYELATQEGASFVFGWPNQNSYPSFKKKLDWQDLGNMVKFTVKVPTLPLAKLSVKAPFIRGLYLSFFKTVSKTNSITLQSAITDNSVKRSRDYLAYKETQGVFEIPTHFGNIVASLDYRLKIGDLSSVQTDDLPRLFQMLKKMCSLCGIDEIQFILSPNSRYISILENLDLKKSEDLPLMYWPFTDDLGISELHFTGLDYDGF